MPSPPNEKLSRREREIMDAIFALGDRASAEEIRARLTDPPSYSAVRAMLVKLEAKGSGTAIVSGTIDASSSTRGPSSSPTSRSISSRSVSARSRSKVSASSACRLRAVRAIASRSTPER